MIALMAAYGCIWMHMSTCVSSSHPHVAHCGGWLHMMNMIVLMVAYGDIGCTYDRIWLHVMIAIMDAYGYIRCAHVCLSLGRK